MQVLLAERNAFMRTAFAKALRKHGHKVTVTGQFVQLRGTTLGYVNSTGRKVRLPGIQAALIDGLPEHAVTGSQAVAALKARGIPCLGIAVMDDCTASLSKAGASLVLTKPVALAAVYAGILPIEQLANPSDELKAALTKFGEEYRDDEKLTKELHALVQPE